MANNIFIYGDIGSGKSTVCATISNYFIESRGMALHHNFDNKDGTLYLIEQWLKRIQANKFPLKTTEEIFLKVDFAIENKVKAEKMGISFFEASGEEIVKTNPLHIQNESCSDLINNWLEKAHVILIVAPCENCKENKFNLSTFLSSLISRGFGNKPIGFILSKADLIPPEYSSFTEFGLNEYKEALSLLNSNDFTNDTKLFPFSIGKVDPDSKENFTKLDYSKGAEKLAKWILDLRRKRT